MMKTIKMILIALMAFSLVSCATPYQKGGFMGGYNDTQIDANTARVSFRGNGFTSRDQVENNMLRRCAEVTIQRGYDYFVIISGTTTPSYSSYTSPGTYRSYTNTNVNMYGNTGYAYSNTYGTYQPGQTTTFSKYESSVMIRMYSGEKSYDGYNAREILANLSKN